MSKVSILVPSRNETYLQRTVQDIYEKATGEFEVIIAFDGPPYQSLPDYPNLIRLELPQRGTKPNLNEATKIATGQYLLKADAHCMFSKGFDEVLQADMQDNWVVMPRFYVLNAEEWRWQDERFYDYFYLPCPLTDPRLFRFQAGGQWKERTRERLDIPIDENMKLHGSAFFLSRNYFLNCLGGLEDNGSGSWSGEDIEISLKTWLGPWDGKVMVNKNCWYAHMHKGKQHPRGWNVSSSEINTSYLWTANYWMGNKWTGQVYDLQWLVERFYPIPSWPTDWKQRWQDWLSYDRTM